MIREGKPLPDDVPTKVPALVAHMAGDEDVVALYFFGSAAEGRLEPLSDLDFAVLPPCTLDKRRRLKKHLDLIGDFTDLFRSEEVDLVILNDAPLRFAYRILDAGKCLHCSDRKQLIDFLERTTKLYLDFKPLRNRFDQVFLEGIGYHG